MCPRFLAFETGWEVMPLPQNGNWESTGFACSRKLVEVYLMFLKDHIVISVSK